MGFRIGGKVIFDWGWDGRGTDLVNLFNFFRLPKYEVKPVRKENTKK